MPHAMRAVCGSFWQSCQPYGQTDAAAAPTSPDRTYRLLREDEDWSFSRTRYYAGISGIRLNTFLCERRLVRDGRRRNPGSPGAGRQ